MNKVAVYGGLGNQMFQYAFYLSLKASGINARLSLSHYLHYWFRNFELSKAFNIKTPFKTGLLIFFLTNVKFIYKQKIVRAFLRRVISFVEKKQLTYKEKKEFVYDEEVFNQKNVMFSGTWQALKYFEPIAEQVKSEFEFKQPTDEINQKLTERIKKCNAVSLHVRRTDYLSKEWAESLFVIKDIAYYKNAVNYITEKEPDVNFFIFSDDVKWVKENLNIPNCTFVEHNSNTNGYFDMYLMSLCKHNIIANSTFSWWGAWLNSNEDKIVIMPEKWMNNNKCEGIFPNTWIKMKV